MTEHVDHLARPLAQAMLRRDIARLAYVAPANPARCRGA